MLKKQWHNPLRFVVKKLNVHSNRPKLVQISPHNQLTGLIYWPRRSAQCTRWHAHPRRVLVCARACPWTEAAGPGGCWAVVRATVAQRRRSALAWSLPSRWSQLPPSPSCCVPPCQTLPGYCKPCALSPVTFHQIIRGCSCTFCIKHFYDYIDIFSSPIPIQNELIFLSL